MIPTPFIAAAWSLFFQVLDVVVHLGSVQGDMFRNSCCLSSTTFPLSGAAVLCGLLCAECVRQLAGYVILIIAEAQQGSCVAIHFTGNTGMIYHE